MQRIILDLTNEQSVMNNINLKDKVAVITGGAGIICSAMARSLSAQGVKTVILDLKNEAALKVAKEIEKEFKTASIGLSANVLDKASLETAKKAIHDKFGPCRYSCKWSRRKFPFSYNKS